MPKTDPPKKGSLTSFPKMRIIYKTIKIHNSLKDSKQILHPLQI